MRRVAVTGLGAVTPLGNDARSTWEAAVAGESGIAWIRAFDASEFPVKVAAEVKDFDPTQVATPKEVRKLERNVLLEQEEVRRDRGADRVSPNFLPNVLVDSASGQLAISLGLKGPNYAVVSACATGSHAIGEGAELVNRGDPRDQGRLRSARIRPRRLVDEVGNGPHVRRGRRDRGDDVRPRVARRSHPADDQLRAPRPGA